MNSGKNRLINESTKIKDLLAVNQEEVVTALTGLNKNFSKLNNPLLRKLFAGRVTIADACKVARCAVPDFLQKMKEIGFRVEETVSGLETDQADPLVFNAGDEIIDLDVRPILSANADPLKIILQHATGLRSGQCLKVINTFIPVPLINLLAKKGFSHRTETVTPDLIHTYFKPGSGTASTASEMKVTEKAIMDFDDMLQSLDPDRIRHLDVRELEMPRPMLSILESLEILPEGKVLFVYHKKVPVYFLPQLHEKGFEYLLKHTEEGKVNMLIFKP